jgi:diadenosine tetraphosphatase ApaH/serine/threonine PP2A family protein phosphatase
MRIAVISDIHANLHAFEAVLAELDREQLDELWCLGDLVGYGPHPNEVTEIVADRADVCLIGNHDLVALGRLDVREFNPDAAAAAQWTANTMTPETRTFLESLEPSAKREGVELFHASPLDPVWEYILTGDAALAALEATAAPVILVGHSHVALAIRLTERRLEGGLAPHGTNADLADARWLLNPGSVGQPRDGDPRAAYLLIDVPNDRASFRRVEYPVAQTQAEIRERGLPDALAERLAHGV